MAQCSCSIISRSSRAASEWPAPVVALNAGGQPKAPAAAARRPVLRLPDHGVELLADILAAGAVGRGPVEGTQRRMGHLVS